MYDMKGRKEWKMAPRFLAWARGYHVLWSPSSPRSDWWHGDHTGVFPLWSLMELHGVHLFVWLSVCMLALILIFFKILFIFKTRKKLVEKCSINAESQPHYFLWFSPLWLFFQYLLSLFFLPPLFALHFRPLAWTIVIAQTYPHASGSPVHCGRKTFIKYKHDHGSFLPKSTSPQSQGQTLLSVL